MIKKFLIAGMLIGGCWVLAEYHEVECSFTNPETNQSLGTIARKFDADADYVLLYRQSLPTGNQYWIAVDAEDIIRELY